MISLIDFLASGVVDSSGNPLSGGSVTFYAAGTTTQVSVYQDRELEVAHPNPATLDSAGRLVAFANQRIKLVIADSTGTILSTLDNLGIGSGDIQSSDIANGAVETSNIADGAVTAAKLASGAVTAGKIQASAITSTQIAAGAVTKDKLSALGQQVSISSGAFSSTSSSPTVVTNSGNNVQITITTTGRPVFLCLVPDGTTNASSIYRASIANQIQLFYSGTQANGTVITSTFVDSVQFGLSTASAVYLPSSSFMTIHQVVAGTYTYLLKALSDGTNAVQVNYAQLVGFEIA